MRIASYIFMYIIYTCTRATCTCCTCTCVIIDILGGCEDSKLGEGAAFCGVEVSRLIPACVRIVLSADSRL